ncbi:alpha/beta hydrolase family protein [Thermomonas haemolytica]|uniref:Dipeptidyl aminopeptidase/acylaminoacyl peptidase n=1 Tax=Thermomonas haemolytica TaxID=141949 RepID=A0A4R3N5A6_9GAMM|nr:S9 family peptidase [Thermomonas haemolytica]TCT24370.1 dipeptidyl aminopeptidase/acylaminoacyl peptidase [Thermomonas haemolytica]TNY28661.1 peptidase S9 [Thermomonas haemolytica]
MTLRHALLPLALALSLPALAADAPPAARHGFTVQDMAYMDRYSAPTLSPDGRVLVFAKRTVDKDTNKASTTLWMRNLVTRDLRPPQQVSPEGWSVNSPAFAPDGKTLYFLSAKSGSMQLYAMPLAGGEPKRLTDFPIDVDAYQLSPDGKQVALAFAVFPDCQADLACTKKKLDEAEAVKATGKVFDRLFIRHWDAWNDGRLNRVFAAPLGGAGMLTSATLLSGGIHGDIPSKPFGDLSDFAWSPDGKTVAMSVRQANREEPWSTNFDIWLVNADGSGARNLTAANKAWDAGPVFSADGKTLYYRAMKRPGFEADRFALMAMDLATGKTREIAPRWDASADGIRLSADGKWIYTTAQELGQHPLFRVSLANGEVETVAKDGSVSAFDLAGPTLALARNSLVTGDVLYTTSLDGKAPLRQITPSAAQMLPDVAWGAFEQFKFRGWNDETVHGYVVKPWNYQPGKKYPVAFLIHGGPQGSFGNGWSYRWNPQTYAGQGYAVVMIDFHGSTGYGQAFTDSISGHWGDRPLEDLQKGWDYALKAYPFLDGDKACALGASYGGFMAYWIAGNWNQPWKCIVAHDGVFDNFMMGYATEELWFSEWENGGTPFENPDGYQKFNPANHVKDWRVPILIIHGQQDFRIPVEQGIAAFTAAQRKDVESKFLYFPDENHWVLKPQNSVLWHETVNAWLKQHIGQ